MNSIHQRWKYLSNKATVTINNWQY